MPKILTETVILATIGFLSAPVHAGDGPGIPGALPPKAIGDHACHYLKAQSAPDITLAFTITSDGTTKDLRIEKSSGVPEMDEVAIRCVSAFKYQPATLNGQAIDYPWSTRVNWMTGTPVSPDLWPGLNETRKHLNEESPESDGIH